MERYISIKVILDDLTDHPLLKDLTLERVVNHTVHFMRIVGMPKIYIEKTATLDIEDYRATLPCDYYKIIQVRNYKTKEVFRSSTDNFHYSKNKTHSYDLTYKLQGQVIYTSIKNGTIEISYTAIPVDCDGYPMIPDNSSFILALEAYIKKKQFNILLDLNKITPAAFNQACQDYAWLVGQAQSDLIMPSIDELESISSMWNTLIPRVEEHKTAFINNGSREKIKIQ